MAAAACKDSLASLDFELAPDQLKRLGDANPLELGIPEYFFASAGTRNLIFGGTYALIDQHAR